MLLLGGFHPKTTKSLVSLPLWTSRTNTLPSLSFTPLLFSSFKNPFIISNLHTSTTQSHLKPSSLCCLPLLFFFRLLSTFFICFCHHDFDAYFSFHFTLIQLMDYSRVHFSTDAPTFRRTATKLETAVLRTMIKRMKPVEWWEGKEKQMFNKKNHRKNIPG